MGDDTNSGPTGEQPTSADIDQGALAQLKRQLGELTGGELDLTDVQVIKGVRVPGPARPRPTRAWLSRASRVTPARR